MHDSLLNLKHCSSRMAVSKSSTFPAMWREAAGNEYLNITYHVPILFCLCHIPFLSKQIQPRNVYLNWKWDENEMKLINLRRYWFFQVQKLQSNYLSVHPYPRVLLGWRSFNKATQLYIFPNNNMGLLCILNLRQLLCNKVPQGDGT